MIAAVMHVKLVSCDAFVFSQVPLTWLRLEPYGDFISFTYKLFGAFMFNYCFVYQITFYVLTTKMEFLVCGVSDTL